ncbi:hypothetical protein QJU39_06180 [Pasteurella atlantica]|nr:hypothetical protein [Pasteurella atlantica]
MDFYTNEGEHFFLCTKKSLPREAEEGIWIFIQMKVNISSYAQKNSSLHEAEEGIWIFIQMKVSISSYVQKNSSLRLRGEVRRGA